MQNNESRPVFNIPSDNRWIKDTFLFDKFIALKGVETPAARREICNQITGVLKNHSHKDALLEKYNNLFLNDPNLQILLTSNIDDLEDASITAAAAELTAKFFDKEGQLGTEEKRKAKRQELFEYQAFYENQKELYPFFLTSNEAEPDYSKFEERMNNLSTHYSSSRELEKDDVGFLFYSACAWLRNGKESIDSLRSRIEFLGVELNYDSKKLNEEQKFFIIKKLQANKPLMITLTNGAHHVSVQILNLDGKYEVHLFDGMSPLERSYANDWATDLHSFLQNQFGQENVKDGIVDEHHFVQSAVNCGLTSAIGGACVMMNALTKDTFDELKKLSNFVGNHDWNKIPFILKEQIFTVGQSINSHMHSLNTNTYFFFAETQAKMDLLRTLNSIRNHTLENNSSITRLSKFSQTNYSNFELFLYCLFSERFFISELNEFAKFSYAYTLATESKKPDPDEDIDDKIEQQPAPLPETENVPAEFINKIYHPDLVNLLNNVSAKNENDFLSTASQFALALLFIAAAVVAFKNELSFSSISNSFSL